MAPGEGSGRLEGRRDSPVRRRNGDPGKTMQEQEHLATTTAEGGTRGEDPGAVTRGAWYQQARQMRVIALELLGTAAFVVVYFLLRGSRPEAIDASVQRGLHIIQFEQRIGIFHEVTWQQYFLGNDLLIGLANFIYAWLHFPVMAVIAVWLVMRDLEGFRFVRNVLVLSAIIGVCSYWILPTAPPRLMEAHGYDYGFTDTVHGGDSGVNYFQPGPFVNDYAAVPSFHFAWIALSSAALWMATRNRLVRAGAVGMSLAMWWAVTVTGNHYFFDMVMGGVVVWICWMFARWVQHTAPPGWWRPLLGHPPHKPERESARPPEPPAATG